MWITGDVNLPETVVNAHVEGRLVFFVGAGASFDAPSSLPSFASLVSQLASMAQVPFDNGAGNGLDRFLGNMPRGFDTHRHARDIIARADSLPNAVHKAIIQLASVTGGMRIVTTNFDNLLESAASELKIEVPDRWDGPALPLGDDFTGIVHLHGSVQREPRELVLTDQDFGAAYLNHAWAPRFLLSMFREFTVLFIGYSHEDPVMDYLARGLPSGTHRYAFTSEPDDAERWFRLGITPIEYPVPEPHNHQALTKALETWNHYSRMARLEHRNRMREVIIGGTTLAPVDHDYVAGRLKTPEGAADFTGSIGAADPMLQIAWLEWLEGLPLFKAMFRGENEPAGTPLLASWFGSTVFGSPELYGAGLVTVQRLGFTFSYDLFRAATFGAGTLSRQDSVAGRQLTALLATSVLGHSAPIWFDTLVPHSREGLAGDRVVLRAALRPYLALQSWPLRSKHGNDSQPPSAEVRWNIGESELSDLLSQELENMPAGDSRLGVLLVDALMSAHDLLDAYYGSPSDARLAFMRAAIEPHPQDDYRQPIDALIDALRVYGEKTLGERPSLIEEWWSLERTLFRRLAIHLLNKAEPRTDDEKINWLLDRSLLFQLHAKHEVFRVLESSTSKASPETLRRLLADSLAGSPTRERGQEIERSAKYEIYNLLVWLVRTAPEWAEAANQLETLRRTHPDFGPREHPDMNWSMTVGWGPQLPLTPEDLVAAVRKDRSSALQELLDLMASVGLPSSFDWDDTAALVRRATELRPEIGEALYSEIEAATLPDEQAIPLHRAIIGAWAEVDLGAMLDKVVTRIGEHVNNASFAWPISQFLSRQVTRLVESEETESVASLRQIAHELWREHGDKFSHSADMDPTLLSLNSWPGELARYWVTEIDRRWRISREDWQGLSAEERTRLVELLAGHKPALDATIPALARQLWFLFAADKSFAIEHLLPLFDDETTAGMAWSAYLHQPRWNDLMLDAGLLASTIKQWDRLDTLEPALKGQFFQFVTSILSQARITNEARRQLLNQSVLSGGGAFRLNFADAVVSYLQVDGINGSEVWKHWLCAHLSKRLNGVPRSADPEELARWANVVLHLGDDIPGAIELLNNYEIGLGAQFFAPTAIERLSTSHHGFALAEHFADRIRATSPIDARQVYLIRELIEAVQKRFGDQEVQPLVKAATAKGIW
jgi:hypothetical protein